MTSKDGYTPAISPLTGTGRHRSSEPNLANTPKKAEPESERPEDEFIEKYRPEEDEPGCYYRQRDPGDPDDAPEIERARNERRLWTVVEGDDNIPVITFGMHVVNHMYNIITEVPCAKEDEDIVYRDEPFYPPGHEPE